MEQEGADLLNQAQLFTHIAQEEYPGDLIPTVTLFYTQPNTKSSVSWEVEDSVTSYQVYARVANLDNSTTGEWLLVPFPAGTMQQSLIYNQNSGEFVLVPPKKAS
ncbi:hypothetical protein BKI52_19240 [marine bacterium AO1-C]|nr:hypothetical protein BKI52_19240 [marine bacterium AO1-C]